MHSACTPRALTYAAPHKPDETTAEVRLPDAIIILQNLWTCSGSQTEFGEPASFSFAFAHFSRFRFSAA